MRQAMVVNFRTDGGPAEEEAFNRFLDAVQDELLELESVTDPTVSASLSDGTLSIMLTVDAETPEALVKTGMGAIRTAFHAAGAATPDWPTSDEWLAFSGLLVGEGLIGSPA
jgi:hypothetical protein